MILDYFYGQQAEIFSFIRIPKLLLTGEMFKDISFGAKILYGILLDRMSLSIKNRWMYHLYVQDKINACKDKYDELDTSEVESDWDMLFKSFLVYILTHNTTFLESDEIVEIKDADATFQEYVKTAVNLTLTVKETENKKILVVKARVLSKDELMETDTDSSFGYKNFYSVVEEYIGDTISHTKDIDKYDYKMDYKEKLKNGTDDGGGEEESETETTEEETRRGGGGSFNGR